MMIGLTTRNLKFNVSIFMFSQKQPRKPLFYQYKNVYAPGIRGYVVTFNNRNLCLNKEEATKVEIYKKCVCKIFSTAKDIDNINFEKISTETLESLSEYFDQVIEEATHLKDADVSYGDGVLTIKFGSEYGTYVINRQVPNQQIWLSSPKSGPKRYDLIEGKWIYKHDGRSLHDLLNEEISIIVKRKVSFNKCSYSLKNK